MTTRKKGGEGPRKEAFGGDGYVYYLDYSDGNKNIIICPKSPNSVHVLSPVFCIAIIPP